MTSRGTHKGMRKERRERERYKGGAFWRYDMRIKGAF